MVLTLAATSSEAVCMAIGQILSTDAAGTERAEGERVFHSDRALSKARLVDALIVLGGMELTEILKYMLWAYSDYRGNVCAPLD